jgi:hypothetical protein
MSVKATSVGPCVTSIDYVLAHTGFMGSCKLSSFDSHWVGWYLTSPVVMYTGIVYGPPMDSPVCGITWKTCTRERWDPTQLFDRCRKLWLHVGSWRPCICVLPGYPLQGVYWFESPWHPQIWVMAWSLCPNVEVQTPLCLYENYVNDMTTWLLRKW